MAFSFQPKVVSDGLIFCVDAGNTKSYPGSGTVWSDLSRTQVTGSLTNGPTFNTSNGGSIVFDGTNDNVVFSNTLGNNISNITLEAWVILNRTNITTNVDHIVSKGNSGDFQYALRVVNVNSNGSVSVLAWQADGNDYTYANSITPLNDGKWHHIIGVIQEGVSATLYVDGVSKQTRTTLDGTWNKTGSGSFMIGGRADGANYLTGSVASVRVYNRALSATEVLQNYNALKGRFGLT